MSSPEQLKNKVMQFEDKCNLFLFETAPDVPMTIKVRALMKVALTYDILDWAYKNAAAEHPVADEAASP